MHYVVLYTNAYCSITQVEPPADDSTVSRILPVETLTQALAIQSLVWQAHELSRDFSQEAGKLRDTINTQAEIIRKQHFESDELRNVINGFRVAIKHILNRVALMVALTMTHREKSAQLRDIATQINDLLRTPHSDFSRIVPDDDIPF